MKTLTNTLFSLLSDCSYLPSEEITISNLVIDNLIFDAPTHLGLLTNNNHDQTNKISVGK